MLKDHQFIFEQSGFTLELESFENEGIVLDLFFGSGKSLSLELYDELNERFTDHYKIVCQILDPFIIEKLENEIKKCFTKWCQPQSTEYSKAIVKNQPEFTRLSDQVFGQRSLLYLLEK